MAAPTDIQFPRLTMAALTILIAMDVRIRTTADLVGTVAGDGAVAGAIAAGTVIVADGAVAATAIAAAQVDSAAAGV